MERIIGLFTTYQPLSLRGLAFLVLAAAGLYFVAVPESDLVAWIVCGGALIVLAAALLLVLFSRIRLRRRLSASLFFDAEDPRSKTPVGSSILLKELSLLPFTELQISRQFEEPGPLSPAHRATGRTDNKRLLDTVKFPHRGNWRCKGLNLKIADSLGLTRLSWPSSSEASLSVSAQTLEIEPLPVVAASSRAGDRISFSDERTGDPFDLKAYEPADGIKRILWKNYARTGELIVRRQEPAILPDGEVAIYLVAKKTDEHVAGALQSYLDQLFQAQVTVVLGTDGLSGYKSDRKEIQECINAAAFNANAGSGRGFANYLSNLENLERRVGQVVVFGPGEGDKNLGWLELVAKQAQRRSIQLSLALVEKTAFEHGSKVKKDQLLHSRASKLGAKVIPCTPLGRA